MSNFKTPTYRNRKLLGLAKNIDRCMMCGKFRPLCMSHSNQGRHGHGRGIKSHDLFVAAICFECHGEIDSGSSMSRAERVEAWNVAHEKTLLWLFSNGYLGVTEGRNTV